PLLCSAAATPELYTLSLHDALPILLAGIHAVEEGDLLARGLQAGGGLARGPGVPAQVRVEADLAVEAEAVHAQQGDEHAHVPRLDRKSTRLNSSHVKISYAVFCLKK